MKKNLKVMWHGIGALLFGTVLTFAFAPYQIFPLAVLALAGLLTLIYPASAKQAAWLGFIFGVGFFGAGVYWVYISIHQFGEAPPLFATGITAALVVFLSLFPMACCYYTKRYFSSSTKGQLLLAFPALWVLSEWLRSMLFTGFPWLLLGYSQTNSPLKGYAPLFSVYGVSLVIALTSGLLVFTIISYRQKAYQQLYLSLLGISMLWITGSMLCLISWTATTGKPIAVSLIQGNIPQSLKWSPEHLYLSFDRYEQLTDASWGENKLIVWPEAAIPLPLKNAENFIEEMDKKALKNKSTLILGIPIKNPTGEGYYNALITLGSTKEVYQKRRLVPFGEYIPLKKVSEKFFNFLHIPMSDNIPGDIRQPWFTVGDVKIAPSICYEITYPELMNPRNSSIGLLLTVTNDAWFGKSSAKAQHLQMAIMRAIELGRPVLFVSNDGITAIIGPQGNILASAPPYEPYVLNGTVQPMTGMTPWMNNGMDPLLAILFVLLFIAYRLQKPHTLIIENNNERTILPARD